MVDTTTAGTGSARTTGDTGDTGGHGGTGPAAGYRVVDADNHYFEPDDAFTRHLDRRFADRAVHIRRGTDGIGRPYFGNRPLYYLERTPVDRMGRPGAWRFDKDGRYQPLPEDDLLTPGQIPHFARREARLEWMATAGVEACLLWPSLGLGVEMQLRDDPPACVANLRSFNRWLDDEWGFDHRHQILGVPWLTLIDLDEAVRELDAVLDRGARAVAVLFGPVAGRSPADPYFDPFWARCAEAGVPVGFHGADSGYCQLYSVHWGEPARPPANAQSPFQRAAFFERAIVDTLAALVLHNLFGRHPTLQVMSVENGSAWVPYLLRVMDKGVRTGMYGKWLGGPVEDRPSDVFRRHVSVAPDDDDDIRGLVDLIGADRVLLGSDYPHPEGHEDPAHFLDGAGLTDRETALVAHDNAAALLRLDGLDGTVLR
ncbi:MAG TPA: amidohydrolase family protein [Acidimicrobiales bacterium]|nr:amidohydrolase family protein [Acidimicrobiales bacterium]